MQQSAAEIGRRAERELEALVAISSPSGDRQGAEECISVCAVLAPDEAALERIPCSSPDHAPDLVARLSGTGSRRILLLGHVDTVVAHDDHRPLERDGDKLVGSGAVDMKGGDVLALGVLRALTRRRADFAEAAVLLVCDEEWRTAPFGHVDRFAGWDACLCFEAGERTADRRGGHRRAPQGGGDGPHHRARAGVALGLRAGPRAATPCSPSPPPPRPSPTATTPRAPRV